MSEATLKVRAYHLKSGSYLVFVLGEFAPGRWEILRETEAETFAHVEQVAQETQDSIVEALRSQGVEAEILVELEGVAKA